MKITEGIRKYAAEQGLSEDTAKGADVYTKA
jgi:hypothetical protein